MKIITLFLLLVSVNTFAARTIHLIGGSSAYDTQNGYPVYGMMAYVGFKFASYPGTAYEGMPCLCPAGANFVQRPPLQDIYWGATVPGTTGSTVLIWTSFEDAMAAKAWEDWGMLPENGAEPGDREYFYQTRHRLLDQLMGRINYFRGVGHDIKVIVVRDPNLPGGHPAYDYMFNQRYFLALEYGWNNPGIDGYIDLEGVTGYGVLKTQGAHTAYDQLTHIPTGPVASAIAMHFMYNMPE